MKINNKKQIEKKKGDKKGTIGFVKTFLGSIKKTPF